MNVAYVGEQAEPLPDYSWYDIYFDERQQRVITKYVLRSYQIFNPMVPSDNMYLYQVVHRDGSKVKCYYAGDDKLIEFNAQKHIVDVQRRPTWCESSVTI